MTTHRNDAHAAPVRGAAVETAPFDPREWREQELARDAARTAPHASDASVDPDAYARIARALRSPPAERLPSNFAWQVAQLAARSPRAAPLDLRLERWLLRGLVATLAVGALASLAVFGGGALHSLDSAGSGASMWALLLGGCVVPTLCVEAWRALRGTARAPR